MKIKLSKAATSNIKATKELLIHTDKEKKYIEEADRCIAERREYYIKSYEKARDYITLY